jgi:acetylornithine deacetylase/succinyl-diaminopimelate desuccinylase-like protein
MEPTKLLCELIALPSVNPAFLPAGDPRAGESRVADFLTATAARLKLDLDFQEVFHGRRNVLARLTPAGSSRRRVVLAPHLDTVVAAEEQFQPRTKNGRIFGRGACDTKGSVAAMFCAMAAVAASGRRPRETELVFAGLMDEENEQRGSRTLAASGLRADLAIVGEPTRLRVVTAHKGDLWLRFTTRGKAAHGALPELGRNAVHMMARVVGLLERDYAAGLRRRRHPLLGTASISVGTIAGGTQPNVVPDHCEMSADRRMLPGETIAGVCRELRALLREHGLQAEVADSKTAPCLPMETDAGAPLVRELMRLAGQRRPAGVHYFCDASVLAHAGIPSVVFGPGDIAQAHTADEWIAVASLERATRLLTAFLRDQP